MAYKTYTRDKVDRSNANQQKSQRKNLILSSKSVGGA